VRRLTPEEVLQAAIVALVLIVAIFLIQQA